MFTFSGLPCRNYLQRSYSSHGLRDLISEFLVIPTLETSDAKIAELCFNHFMNYFQGIFPIFLDCTATKVLNFRGHVVFIRIPQTANYHFRGIPPEGFCIILTSFGSDSPFIQLRGIIFEDHRVPLYENYLLKLLRISRGHYPPSFDLK